MHSYVRGLISYCAIATLFVTSSLYAEEAEDAQGSDDESEVLEEIVVRAHPLSHDGVAQSYSVLQGDELARAVEASIGETLESIAGIRNASFGPVVGRPVIHGLGGVRVKTMVDRTNTMDLSMLLPDHPVSANPHMANLIEVIKGPSSMVYGSETIGGIVNVDTGRIPKAAPAGGWEGRLDASMSDNAARQTLAGRIDLGVDNFILHGDFDIRQGDDYDIPGCANSSYFHDEEEEHHNDEGAHHDEDEDHHDEEEAHEEICGTLLNSYFDVFAGSVGGSYVNELGYLGVSVSSNYGDYGVPVPHTHGAEEEHHEDDHDEADHEGEDEHHEDEEDHHEEDETPRSFIDFEQQRLDFDVRRDDVSDSIRQLQLRLAVSEYQHDEIEEPGGPVDAKFINDEYEFRVDATLDRENTSVVGAHLSGRDYQVITDEDPVLPVTESRLGFSWLHERVLGSSTLELGTRIEAKKIDSDEFGARNFSDYALSLGLLSDQSRDWTFKVELSQSSRAPMVEELASRGFHLATSAVEVGNPDLESESQTGFTVGASKTGGNLELDLTAYHRRFTDFIYIANSGEFDHGAPVFTYLHRNATFTGFDGSALYHLELNNSSELDLRLQYDSIAVSVDRSSVNRLPQIPSDRATIGFDLYSDVLFASLELTQNMAVTKPAMLELPTDSWFDVSTRIEYTFAGIGDTTDVTVYIKGKNLTDEEQRNHISVIKDRVPLLGRMLEVGFRLSM